MVRRILLAFLVWKVLVLSVAVTVSHIIPLRTIAIADKISVNVPYLQWIWANFDGVNYLQIARSGYYLPNFAYFPLYSFLIVLFNKMLGLSHLHAGLILSQIALLISLVLLYKIVRIDYDINISWKTILVLFTFPTAFFYGAVYADSLYLLLSLLSFYMARKSRWLLSGLLGGLAGGSRLIGIVLLPVLLLEWLIQQLEAGRWKMGVFFLFLIPLGLIGYGLYLQINFGDFLLFQKSMAHWQQAQTVLPIQTLFRYLKIFVTAEKNLTYFVAVVEFLATIAYFALSAYTFLKIRKSYGLFMFLTLLIPTFTGTLQSMPRYFLHAFPTFLGLVILTQARKKLFWAMIVVFVILQAIFVAMFTRGYFIA